MENNITGHEELREIMVEDISNLVGGQAFANDSLKYVVQRCEHADKVLYHVRNLPYSPIEYDFDFTSAVAVADFLLENVFPQVFDRIIRHEQEFLFMYLHDPENEESSLYGTDSHEVGRPLASIHDLIRELDDVLEDTEEAEIDELDFWGFDCHVIVKEGIFRFDRYEFEYIKL